MPGRNLLRSSRTSTSRRSSRALSIRPPQVRRSDMGYHFRQHYTVEQARALLPQVRQWLDQLVELRKRLERADKPIEQILGTGHDAGGEPVHRMVRLLVEIKDALREFQRRDIQLKDLERGLIDFPAI